MLKGLEALERLVYAITHDVNAYSQYTQSQPFINKDKALVEKELKALEIIRNKGVNIGNFKAMLEDWKDLTFENYINYRIENSYELQSDYDFETNSLTQEEYDLLKEVLL